MAITITEEELLKASTYISVAAKESLTRYAAELCVEPVEMKSGAGDALPPRYRENRRLRQQFMYGILGRYYLHREYKEQEIEYTDPATKKSAITAVKQLMDTEAYDEWAGSHVINQIERFKRGHSQEAANAAFDLLYDYRALEMMMMGAIRDELEKQNDLLPRIVDYMASTMTPEALQSMMGDIESMQQQLEGMKRHADTAE